MNKMWYIHKTEYFPSGVLIQVTTCRNLGNNMLSERSKVQKTSYHMIPFIRNVHTKQIQRQRHISGYQRMWSGGRRMHRKWLLVGTRFCLGGRGWWWKCFQKTVLVVVQLCKYIKSHWTVHKEWTYDMWIIFQFLKLWEFEFEKYFGNLFNFLFW